jgi:glycylpeptide N-tetradecanoyltransferase
LPTPISLTKYWHRPLNIKKLIEIDFSRLGKNQTISRLIKLYKLPETP